MSARSLTPRQSQTAAVLILLVMLVVVAFLIVGPLIAGFQERAAQREQLALQYSANVRNIAAIPRLRRMAGAHEQLLGDFLLEAPDAATAGEALRQRLQAASPRSEANSRSAKTSPRQRAVRPQCGSPRGFRRASSVNSLQAFKIPNPISPSPPWSSALTKRW